MAVISLVIQVLGFILLVAGFRGANRNLMLGAALLLWFGAGSEELAHGFMDGMHGGQRVAQTSQG
ncbi:hypothetical protein [Massilia aerilata]|uniref:Uncharacterized protein n=1 Tax=Massilia aerilata TaxID=453817 RepID=A0ABW0RXT7_9BURK